MPFSELACDMVRVQRFSRLAGKANASGLPDGRAENVGGASEASAEKGIGYDGNIFTA